MPKKLTNTEFIEKSKLKHGDKWDYSKVEYINSKNKVIIICKEHGEFIQTASDHLSGCGCPKCDKTNRLTTSNFIERSILVHGDKFDYTKTEYGNNNYDLVKIICKEHGEFRQRPWAHLRGQGCPNCSNNKLVKNSDFIKRCIEIHGDKWDYSKLEYNGRRNNITIICRQHGEFQQEARVHLDGFGCKFCNSSKMEDHLSDGLIFIGEFFEKDKRFKECRNINPLPFDFYLPHRNILIECDGIQHHQPIDYFGGKSRFEYQKKNDDIKNKWCVENNISLIRLNNIDEINQFLKNLNNN